MRCCLMACLLKVLSDMLQSLQPLSYIYICPKPKVKLGPTKSSIRSHRVSSDISTAKTLINSVSPMGSRSHRDGLANSLLPIAIISVTPKYAIGLTECAWPTLCFAYYPNRSKRVHVIGLTEITLCPKPSSSVPPS